MVTSSPTTKSKYWNSAAGRQRCAALSVPDCWPLTPQGHHCTYLFRILKTDGSDWVSTDHAAKHMGDDGSQPRANHISFVREVLRSVRYGSDYGYDNPFWPTSTSIRAAREWRSRADDVSSRQIHGREGHYRVCIRIDIWAWFQSGTMPPAALIDLSTIVAQRKIYKSLAATYGFEDEDFGKALRWSVECKEVLVKWRGEVPMEYCEVVDECDEHTSLGKVREILNHARENRLQMDSEAVKNYRLVEDLAVQTALQAAADAAAAAAAAAADAAAAASAVVAAEETSSMPFRARPHPPAHPAIPYPLSEAQKNYLISMKPVPAPITKPHSQNNNEAVAASAASSVVVLPAPTAKDSIVAPSHERQSYNGYGDPPCTIEGIDSDLGEESRDSFNIDYG